MKKMFKMFGIALLACSLLTVACSKDEDTTTTTTTNNSGSNKDIILLNTVCLLWADCSLMVSASD